jgi:hypothetical protein
VSFRSRRGRGWAYASLRFELDECGQSMLMRMVTTATNSRKEPGALDVSAPADLQPVGAARRSVFSRLHQRWLRFQQRQVSRCRVFVIPCVAMRGAGGGGEAVFALARPAFDWRWLRLCTSPLQRLAGAHPRFYAGFMLFFLGLPSIACRFFLQGQDRGIPTIVLNSFLSIMLFGFGLDRVAVKHVALSFRFVILVTLLAADIALSAREVYTIDAHPTTVVAYALASLCFCLTILLDCSPHLPPSVQFFSSVNHRKAAFQKACLLIIDAGRMVDLFWILCISRISRCILWPSRLLHRSWSLQSLRRHSKALHLYQHRVVNDSSADIAHAFARHQQLCERVGEALAADRTQPHVPASVSPWFAIFLLLTRHR